MHEETIANRIPKVAAALGIPLEDYRDTIQVQPMRGKLVDIAQLDRYFRQFPPAHFGLVILDAKYRFQLSGAEENSNSDEMRFYNLIDRYADILGCAIVLVHHASKGSQSAKSVVDVGAGAGAQSRATDTHLVLRPHEERGVIVLDAETRSWPRVASQCLRWAFPVWQPAAGLDPSKLKIERPGRSSNPPEQFSDPLTFVGRFITHEWAKTADIVRAAGKFGLSRDDARDILNNAADDGLILRKRGRGPKPDTFALLGTPGSSTE